jgi:hypothetical protein
MQMRDPVLNSGASVFRKEYVAIILPMLPNCDMSGPFPGQGGFRPRKLGASATHSVRRWRHCVVRAIAELHRP